MKTVLLFLVKFVGTVLAADFVAGLVHWLEDAYVRENTPIIGKFVAPRTLFITIIRAT